uniref:Activator of basal transcription 1 n=1 Tax=Parastrongyloides trichosuri TaxID=131310 RepID=A0A0N4ZP09_PARTI
MSDVDEFDEIEATLPVVREKRNINDIHVQKEKILTLEDIEGIDNDMEIDCDKEEELTFNEKEKKSGVIYLQTVPPLYNVAKVREVLSRYGKINRIHLTVDTKRKSNNPKIRHYKEGWIEFVDKKEAKSCAKSLNCTLVGGKRRHVAADSMWAMKYLKGFKWSHLIEQLNYEKNVERKRLNMEMSKARKEASHFTEQVDKGKSLKKLEEKVLKKGGLWERYQKQITQRKLVTQQKKTKSEETAKSEDFMHLIFDKK